MPTIPLTTRGGIARLIITLALVAALLAGAAPPADAQETTAWSVKATFSGLDDPTIGFTGTGTQIVQGQLPWGALYLSGGVRDFDYPSTFDPSFSIHDLTTGAFGLFRSELGPAINEVYLNDSRRLIRFDNTISRATWNGATETLTIAGFGVIDHYVFYDYGSTDHFSFFTITVTPA